MNDVTVFRIEELEPHPNADRLSLVKAMGYPSIVSKTEFSVGDLAAFIPPDSCVDITRPEFSFLKHSRIRATKIRGIVSQGLVVKAPEGSVEGDVVTDHFGVTHWNPPEPPQHAVNPPRQKYKGLDIPIISPEYDLESIYKGLNRFIPGESVIVTEKLHGCNARFMFDGETVYCGSKKHWVAEDSMWHRALSCNLHIKALACENEGVVFYGELVGDVRDYAYGHGKRYGIYLFDAMKDGQWLSRAEILEMTRLSILKNSLPSDTLYTAPLLYEGPFDLPTILPMAEGKSVLDGVTQREGVVIQPKDVRNDRYGYVKLKLVGSEYLLSK